MADEHRGTGPLTMDEPLVWRVPPWQAAVGFVVAALAASFVLYGGHSASVRILCTVIAVLALVGGVVAVRAFLVVDSDGIGWRRVSGEVSVPWSEIEQIEVSTQHGNRTGLTVRRRTGPPLQIPPLLVQPTMPVTAGTMVQRMHVIARQIREYGERQTG